MLRLVYLGFVVLVGVTNPINFKNMKKKLDTYSKSFVYLVYDK